MKTRGKAIFLKEKRFSSFIGFLFSNMTSVFQKTKYQWNTSREFQDKESFFVLQRSNQASLKQTSIILYILLKRALLSILKY